jgi:dihydrofolate reductase
MRKVIFKIELTLDGFISGPKGEMDWAQADALTDENWKDVFNMLSTVDTVLMSRVIYQGFKEYWPAAGKNPKSSKFEKKYSAWLDKTPKIVFSKTLDQVDWENARLVKGNVGKEISKLKKQPGKNFVFWGGSAFPQALMNLGLIDEYWINVHPIILGDGKPLLTDIKKKIPFNNINTKIFKTGAIGLRYEPMKK